MNIAQIFRSACMGAALAFAVGVLLESGQHKVLMALVALVLLTPGRPGRRLRAACAAMLGGVFTLLAAFAVAGVALLYMENRSIEAIFPVVLVLVFCLAFSRLFRRSAAEQTARSFSRDGPSPWLSGLAGGAAGAWGSSLFSDDDDGWSSASPGSGPWETADSSMGPSADDPFSTSAFDESAINPATGLPMVSGIGGVDVGGSPFGSDIHDSDHGIDSSLIHSGTDDWSSSGMDDWSSSGMDDWSSSSFDDSWS